MRQYIHAVDSPIGTLTLATDGSNLTAVHMGDPDSLCARMAHVTEWSESGDALARAVEQLRAYFAGELTTFTLPLAPHGTPFQQRVWKALSLIPYGTTATYGEIATAVGASGSARAVGAANGRNPIAIVVPCHRVIGADGSLTGFGGGMERKQFLLSLERSRFAPELELGARIHAV